MNNNTWLIIVLACIVFGILDHISAMNEKSKIRSILDVWRHAVNYFITAVLGYFLIVIRWPLITQNASLSSSDFIVGVAFLIGIFGWWPYFVRNVTEGINAIISRTLNK